MIGLSLAGCSLIFENDRDVQARQAIYDLMAIQETFYQKNQRYARSLAEIEQYNLKYHTGIVYMEIESASKDGYRAVSLPAESTTARVFSFDSERGGFYEMEYEEVSKYVLGALNHIRKKQGEINIIDFFSATLVVILSALGFVTARRNKGKYARLVIGSYILCLLSLSWTLAMESHMEKDIFISSIIIEGTLTAFILAAISLILSFVSFGKLLKSENSEMLLNLIICAVIISLCSGGLLLKSYLTYLAS